MRTPQSADASEVRFWNVDLFYVHQSSFSQVLCNQPLAEAHPVDAEASLQIEVSSLNIRASGQLSKSVSQNIK